MRNLHAHLQNVEIQLNLLLEDLSQMVAAPAGSVRPHPESQPGLGEAGWSHELESFRMKAATIRKILARFHNVDLPTRRYLRHHLDEEWSHLKQAYDSLREQFTSKETSPPSDEDGEH